MKVSINFWLVRGLGLKVSVPLRGSGDESFLFYFLLDAMFYLFQSPCGEVVMKEQLEEEIMDSED